MEITKKQLKDLSMALSDVNASFMLGDNEDAIHQLNEIRHELAILIDPEAVKAHDALVLKLQKNNK